MFINGRPMSSSKELSASELSKASEAIKILSSFNLQRAEGMHAHVHRKCVVCMYAI